MPEVHPSSLKDVPEAGKKDYSQKPRTLVKGAPIRKRIRTKTKSGFTFVPYSLPPAGVLRQNSQGRPSTYTKEIGDSILSMIMIGRSVASICMSFQDLPCVETIMEWKRIIPGFAQMYDQAKADSADFLVDQIIDIADDLTESSQSRRVRVEARKWCASQLQPKKYGSLVNQDQLKWDGDPRSLPRESLARLISVLEAQVFGDDQEKRRRVFAAAGIQIVDAKKGEALIESGHAQEEVPGGAAGSNDGEANPERVRGVSGGVRGAGAVEENDPAVEPRAEDHRGLDVEPGKPVASEVGSGKAGADQEVADAGGAGRVHGGLRLSGRRASESGGGSPGGGTTERVNGINNSGHVDDAGSVLRTTVDDLTGDPGACDDPDDFNPFSVAEVKPAAELPAEPETIEQRIARMSVWNPKA